MKKLLYILLIAGVGFGIYKLTKKRKGQTQNVSNSDELTALFVGKNPDFTTYDNTLLPINEVSPLSKYCNLSTLLNQFDVWQVTQNGATNVLLFPKDTKFENGKSYTSFIYNKSSLTPVAQYSFVYGSNDTKNSTFKKFTDFNYLVGVKNNNRDTMSLYVSNDPNVGKYVSRLTI